MTIKVVGFEVSISVLSVIAEKISVLYNGDFKFTETSAICCYLVSKYQRKHSNKILMPHDIHEVALVNQFISYKSFYYEPLIRTIVFQEVFQRIPENPELIKQFRKEIDKVLEVYDKLLEGKEYLASKFL
ncbi:11092_t:CDS:2 [Dentiscutata erythropus]|uniref:glutathione transferase n=1 Tax=Dentiscutata erythropus TaxID=1348616 RepID=A0A9N9JA29_9GLOM|nr:11092_t:CDS:2 [Dentiscutata erythropus]